MCFAGAVLSTENETDRPSEGQIVLYYFIIWQLYSFRTTKGMTQYKEALMKAINDE